MVASQSCPSEVLKKLCTVKDLAQRQNEVEICFSFTPAFLSIVCSKYFPLSSRSLSEQDLKEIKRNTNLSSLTRCSYLRLSAGILTR